MNNSPWQRLRGPRKLRAVFGVLTTSLFASAMLTAAATPPSPPTEPEKIQACFQDDSGNSDCAPTQEELRRLILEKYNKVAVNSPAEFAEVQKTQTYESMAVPASATGLYSLGTIYTDANYGGNGVTYMTSNSTQCYGGTQQYSFENIGDNDQASSYYGAGGCQVMLYQHSWFGGASYGYYNCRSNLWGVFNDIASSVRFRLASATYSCY